MRGVRVAVRRAAISSRRGNGGAVRAPIGASARLTSRRPDLPAAVDDVLLRALAKAPEDRYVSCGEFADALRTRPGSSGTTPMWPSRYTSGLWPIGSASWGWITRTRWLSMRAWRRPTGKRSVRTTRSHYTSRHWRSAADAGPGSPGHAHTRFSIAREMAARGEHTASEDEFRAVLVARRRTLGRITRTRWPPSSPSLRRWRRAATTPERRSRSGRCSWRGSGRWAGITRTCWPPGSASPGRWRRAGIMPGPRTSSGMCSRHGSGAGPRSRGRAWRPRSASPRNVGARRSRRGGGARSGACSPRGSGRWGRITRTRWPPGSASPRRWGRRTAGPRKNPGTCWRRRQRTLGADAPGHAGHLVQHRPGDGGPRRPRRGRGAVPARAGGGEADAGRRSTPTR